MRVEYFERTPLDAEFYDKYIKDRIPSKLIDMHLHFTKPEFCTNLQVDPNSWASQCSSKMEFEDYKYYASIFYPDTEFFVNALPSVTKGIDIVGNNGYIAELKAAGKAKYVHMLVNPEWTGDYTEKMFLEGNFDGYKPYPDYVSGKRGAEIGMFDFVNPDQYEILNKYNKSMVLHLPRAGRYPDDNNIKELLTIREKYPNIKVIIAHCGRSYAMYFITEAARKLGSMFNDFYYDLAAVLNPEVLDFMMANVDNKRIIYGTDLPVFLWHGKRRWTYTEYFNLVREDFKFNKHEEGPEKEADYTFFLYEQLKNILDVTDKYGGKKTAEDIFYNNAVRIVEG